VRARLHVLSEIPSEWRRHVELWARINEPLKADCGLDPETEYFLYQTLLGAWPLGAADHSEDASPDRFVERIRSYMSKAVKEAKRRTSWLNPDPQYEEGLLKFVSALLDPETNASFLEDFLPFQRRVAVLGLYNGLSQLLLKLTCPGVPDVYQGNELWRFDLVDPDNRRPVDFVRRGNLLDELRDSYGRGQGSEMASHLMGNLQDGRAKLFVTWRALCARREHPALFASGDYVPLGVSGERAGHVCAFARSAEGVTLIVAVLKWFAGLAGEDRITPDLTRLSGTTIALPPNQHPFIDGLAGDTVTQAGQVHVSASEMFATWPVAMWIGNCDMVAAEGFAGTM
jgi:(1->4)-alpha-D-glucan 1-alpha-D-glucosylmutase